MKDYLHDITTIDNSTSYILYRTARLVRLNMLKLLQHLEAHITPEQWILLFRLYEKGGQSQVELSDKTFKDPPNITRMLDALAKQKFVLRSSDENDRRKFLVDLTEAGRAFVETMLPIIVEDRKKIFQGFSTEEVATFTGYLNRIEDNVVDKEFK